MIYIDDKYKCCGCNACVQRCPKLCIHMQVDEEGFSYPYVDKDFCIGCNLCEQVCPMISGNEPHMPEAVYAAVSTEDVNRLESSSGGVFFALSEKIIKHYKGIVYGAAFDETWNVRHVRCETLEEVLALRGSKYVQSDVGNCFKLAERDLRDGRTVLFSGTSCQILALRKYLRQLYPKLITLDVICHGVPSPSVWQAYISENIGLSSEGRMCIKDISFRNKKDGWKKFNLTVTGVKIENQSAMTSERKHMTEACVFSECHKENEFMKLFLRNIILRPSCANCPAKKGRAGSDISLGDFWNIGERYPCFDDDKGVSMVLVNTEKGKTVLYDLNIEKIEVDYQFALSGCSMLETSPSESVLRPVFFKNFHKGFQYSVKEVNKQLRLSFKKRLFNWLTGHL